MRALFDPELEQAKKESEQRERSTQRSAER